MAPSAIGPFQAEITQVWLWNLGPRTEIDTASCCQGDRGAKKLDSGLCCYVICHFYSCRWGLGAKSKPLAPEARALHGGSMLGI